MSMNLLVERILEGVGTFFLLYLMGYATFLFASVIGGATYLYKRRRMYLLKNELKHQYYFPVSIVVPAYNEEVTVVDTVRSLLNLEYRLYEIIIVDDGSKDETTKVMVDAFQMHRVDRPIRLTIPCKKVVEIWECESEKVKITLIKKENGGKGDAINMGINASEFPYFVCMDADSFLQKDSLEKIVQPLMEDQSVIAVGGLIRISQCAVFENGVVKKFKLPWNIVQCMQIMEYERSFLASRIFLDSFNGNLIISGAFGLFKKDMVVAVGGYDTNTLGEDMELIVKLHVFCRNNKIKYSIRYAPNAICWSQAPFTIGDLSKQRRRWHLGLFQSMMKYRQIGLNPRFGFLGFLSYPYYWLYELFSAFIELFGLITVILSGVLGLINVPFMILFFLLYALYSAVMTITAFFLRIYTQSLEISFGDAIKAIIMCLLEGVTFRFLLTFIRITAFIGYRKKKNKWGEIKREKQFKDKENDLAPKP